MTWFLLFQAVVTAATALVLFFAPTVLPASLGLVLTPDAYLLCYFYAATEMSLSYLSLVAIRSHNVETRRLLYRYFLFVHAVEGAAGVGAVAQGFPAKVWANSGAHFVIALVFAFAMFQRASATRSTHP